MREFARPSATIDWSGWTAAATVHAGHRASGLSGCLCAGLLATKTMTSFAPSTPGTGVRRTGWVVRRRLPKPAQRCDQRGRHRQAGSSATTGVPSSARISYRRGPASGGLTHTLYVASGENVARPSTNGGSRLGTQAAMRVPMLALQIKRLSHHHGDDILSHTQDLAVPRALVLHASWAPQFPAEAGIVGAS